MHVSFLCGKSKGLLPFRFDRLPESANMTNNQKSIKLRKEVIDLNNLIRKEIVFYFRHRNDNINFDLSGLNPVPEIKCYKIEIAMIFYNLLNNAIYAINEKDKKKGTIAINTRVEEGDYVIEVKDDGIGMEDKIKDRIFEPNFTTKKTGVGIGLYFVRETLGEEDFYGTIDCESRKNKGTTFTIKIPTFINDRN